MSHRFFRSPSDCRINSAVCTTSFGAFTMVMAIATALIATPSLSAQTLKTLHTFNGPDGSLPTQGLIQDSTGNLYGATAYGGDLGCNTQAPPHGCGTIFKLDRTGTLTVLHAFTGAPDGRNPNLPTLGSGNIYGTTSEGGIVANCSFGGAGCGTVFELSTAGQTLAQYSFQGGSDLAVPFTAPTYVKGTVFGTAYYGGTYNKGGLFKVNFDSQGNGTEVILHNFAGGPSDGGHPNFPLVPLGGAFYGTTVYGGTGSCNNGFDTGCGTIYKLTSTGVTILYNFTGGADGSYPGTLIPDGIGGFYGVTYANNGTVFQVTTAGTLITIYTFAGGTDGSGGGGLVRDSSGNLFGTTNVGGLYGYGTIYELSPNGSGGWNETVLYSFTGGKDGSYPQAAIILHEKTRQIFGTTVEGGNTTSCYPPYGCGTAFELSY